MPVTPIVLADLTSSTLGGAGAFDVLMATMREHLDLEYSKNRIRGPEYSQVYLGAFQAVLAQSVQFLLMKDKAANEAALVAAQVAETEAKVQLLIQQKLNATEEFNVLVAQKCKLQAEYDNLMEQKTRIASENALMQQKILSERAQTQSSGVDPDSVIGKQKALYQAQKDGFARDAEQKAAKLLADTWSSRRMTDEGTVADNVNMLSDQVVGRAITKMLNGVGA